MKGDAVLEAILDKFSRPMRDLRISVTDKCNFRCTYCMPKEIYGNDYEFLKQEEQLTFGEIERLAKLFAQLGVRKLRLTGGEPLLRKDLPLLIEKLITIKGIEDIGLTTNGILLQQQAQPLYDVGLRRLNISLDALDPVIFGALNGRGVKPDHILSNIEYAQEIGFEIKVNMVVQKGVNESEIIPMATYFKKQGIMLRFIEFMDVGNDNDWGLEKVVTKKEIYEILKGTYKMTSVNPQYFGEVAQRYRYTDSETEVGFITSVSESFCASCTRARMSSDGKLFTCLFASVGFDLREWIRSEMTDSELLIRIGDIWQERNDRYSDERTEQTVKNRKKIGMGYIGG